MTYVFLSDLHACEVILNLPSTVEMCTPNVYADQIEWMCAHISRRDCACAQSSCPAERERAWLQRWLPTPRSAAAEPGRPSAVADAQRLGAPPELAARGACAGRSAGDDAGRHRQLRRPRCVM